MSISIVVNGIDGFDGATPAPTPETTVQEAEGHYRLTYNPTRVIGSIFPRTLLGGIDPLPDDFMLCRVFAAMPLATNVDVQLFLRAGMAASNALDLVNATTIQVAERIPMMTGSFLTIDANATPPQNCSLAMVFLPLSDAHPELHACCCGTGPRLTPPLP